MANSFGSFLKEKRQEKKLTQKQLANLLIISESAVSKWEKDVAHPDLTMLPKLAEILDVTEHELITASIDNQSRQDKVQAKRWRTFSTAWSLFFYIAYAVALIPCFICNLAIDKTLSWFWIVLSALVLAFTFTNLPSIIKKHKLVLLPLSMYLSLCLLLGVCCIYSNGNWFWIASISVLLGALIVFTPVYIAKLSIFKKVRKYNGFISLAVYFIVLNILLIIIDSYSITNYNSTPWFLSVALPIVIYFYLILNLMFSIKYLPINKLLKTSLILVLSNIFLYLVPRLINISIQKELSDLNIFNADLSSWTAEVTLEQNIHLIIFLTILTISIAFLISGIFLHFKKRKQN